MKKNLNHYLDELLALLPETERLLLILRDGYGYSFIQMTKATGLTYKQVRSRYQKAFQKFKKLFEKGQKMDS
ncbi:MAG TPA: sigma-70 family RNA polymerase sigma factor [Acholeplasmataceae bacterium]|jgi:DNA-directed RNA polymerase specialized sigma24 family protein|nr:sigma-70 family RNA polymerase sigma factor [Acholeplasmataceae bacterium]